MNKISKSGVLCLPALIALALAGCSSSNSSTSDADQDDNNPPNDTSVSLSATVVDPYIEGAIFCVDTNRNKSCDEGEPRSTASTADGSISFELDESLPADSLIIADSDHLGTHNGVDFSLAMGALVGEGADGFVISPMTTLQSSSASLTDAGDVSASLSNENIAELLRTAGLTDITPADISADPMQGISELSGAVTEAQLARIRAALSMYGFMKLYNESDALSDKSVADILASGINDTGNGDDDVYQVLSAMVGAIKDVVSPALIAQSQLEVDTANTNLPPSAQLPHANAEVIVKAGVAIIDRVIDDAATACNQASGNYQAGLAKAEEYRTGPLATAFGTLVGELGLSYYAAHNKAALETVLNLARATSLGDNMAELGAPAALDVGLDCDSGHFTVAADLSYICTSTP